MNKFLTAAIALAIAAPMAASAQNNVTVYGKVDMALTNADREGAGVDDWFIHENGGASKLGFKGTEDLGNGLKAIWKMEFDVPIGRGSSPLAGGGSVGSTRNAYIGLAGDFGTVLMGRHDSPYKVAFGAWDLFADTYADFNNSHSVAFDDPRFQDTIVYISPSFNGLTVAGAIVTGSGSENIDGDPATNNTAPEDDEEIAQHYSIGVMYKNNGIMASLGYEMINGATVARPNVGDDKKWGVALGYEGNGFYVGVRYEDQENARDPFNANNGRDITRWQLGASADFGNNTVKAAYGVEERDFLGAAKVEPTAWVIGLDHNFSKRTKAYVLYTDYDDDSAAAADSLEAFSLGMSHTF